MSVERKAYLHVANVSLNRLELILPISMLKMSKMSEKMHFCQQAPCLNGSRKRLGGTVPPYSADFFWPRDQYPKHNLQWSQKEQNDDTKKEREDFEDPCGNRGTIKENKTKKPKDTCMCHSQNFDFSTCPNKNVIKHDSSGKKGMLSCYKCPLSRLQ